MKQIKQNMVRMTKQRKLIFDELVRLKTHPTAEEIYKAVKRKIPKISLGTVYRNLEVLSGSGMIRKLEFAFNQRRYDGTTEKHYHIHCVNCSIIQDINENTVKVEADSINKASGFKVIGHDIEFIGICPACLKNEAKPN